MRSDRSTTEIVMLVLATMVAFVVLSISLTIAIVKVRDPTADMTDGTQLLTGVVSTVLGALIGLLVGRYQFDRRRKPDED